MEYNHLNSLDIYALRNRLVLLHHFSDLFCPSIAMFDLEHSMAEKDTSGSAMGLDLLRGVLVSSAKVSTHALNVVFLYSIPLNKQGVY